MRDEEFDAMMDRLGPAAQARVLKAMEPLTNEPYAGKRKKASTGSRNVNKETIIPREHLGGKLVVGGVLFSILMVACFAAIVAGFTVILIPVSIVTFLVSGVLLARWFLWVFGLNKKEWK